MDFSAELEQFGKTATGIQVPATVVEALDAGKRPAVVVTINGYSYRSHISPYRGMILLPVSAEVRAGAGIEAGDVLTVTVTVDTAPREVAVPDDLAAAMAQSPKAKEFFAGLAPSHRKEYVRWVEEAKKPETRASRIEKTVALLSEGRKTR